MQAKYWVFSRITIRLIKSINLSFIRWWGNVVYSVEKSYVDNLEAWKFLDLNLLRTSLEFLIDQNSHFRPFRKQYHNPMFLTAVRHKVSSLEKTVVVHELELAMKRAL